MKSLYLVVILVTLNACIPYKIAPKIKDYKVTNAKNFKKGLPNQTAFIFSDPKKENEFCDY